jgi:choline dehydrogenase-like flavoprotein
MATHEKVDAVIVGAGPAGSVYADTLSRAGKKVVVLEFGPDWDNNDLISSEIWGRRIKHAPRFQLAGQNPAGHGSNAGWGTGGSMLHWFANMPRLMPNDFKVKSQYGKGIDWPISYDDLAPWYDKTEKLIGVSGAAPPRGLLNTPDSRKTSASRATTPRRRAGGRRASPIRCRR